MTKNILESLGIIPPSGDEQFEEPTPPPREEFEMETKESRVLEVENSDIHVDYTFARSAIYALIEMNMQMTHRAMLVAKETEHPRAFEAFNSLSSNTKDAVRELVAMQTQAKNIYKDAKVVSKEAEPDSTTTDLRTISLNTNDLLRAAEEREEAARAAAEEAKNSEDGNDGES